MWYELLKIIVLVLGPILVYTAFRATFQVPDLVATLPIPVRRSIEAAGALFIIGACFVSYVEPFSGAMALIGLVLLTMPTVARKLNEAQPVSL